MSCGHELINFSILASPTSIGPSISHLPCVKKQQFKLACVLGSIFCSHCLLLGSEGGALALLLFPVLPVSVQTHLLEKDGRHLKTIDLSGQHTVGRKELGGGGGGSVV